MVVAVLFLAEVSSTNPALKALNLIKVDRSVVRSACATAGKHTAAYCTRS